MLLARSLMALGAVASLAPAQVFLSRAGWTVRSFDSQQAPGDVATNAIDGNPATFWHTQYQNGTPGFPHEIQIDLGASRTVGGFSYQPRQDGCINGTVGQYEFYTSTDGSNWGAAASSGTFTYPGVTLTCGGAGQPPSRVVTFSSRAARYVRFRALSEVNSNPWASMAELNVIDGSGGGGGSTLSTQGQWSQVITTPVNPVGAAVLPDGKVLMWSAYDRYSFGQNVRAQTLTGIFDPATGSTTERMVVETAHDMFCPGTSFLPDGRLLVTGGDTAAKTSVFDPGTASWTSGANMNIPRGYQGQVTLDTGEAFLVGGSWSGGSGGKNGEVWRNNAWTYLPNTLASVTLGPDPAGTGVADRHPWLFAIGNGRVLHAGPSRAMNIYDTTVNNGSTASAGNRSDDVFSQNGTAVMYDIGRILKAGGAPAYDGANATSGCYIVDVTSGVNVTRTGSLRFARGMHNAVVLPNGEVVVMGGMPVPRTFSDTNAIMTAEIWNPATGQWRDAAAISVPRNYHSTALLLPDGRVFSGGGGLCGQGCAANHSDVQIFSPPYLFNADGSPATRPTLTQAPASAFHDTTIDVSTSGAVSFVMVRFGAVTHTVNSDQRRVPLAATQLSTGFYRLAIPGPGIAPPGNYMLFGLNAAGVPSIARTILVGGTPRPSVTIASPAAGAAFLAPASITIAATVSDPVGSVARVEFYNGATRLGQDTSAPYSFTWNNVPAGAYTIEARAIESSGAYVSATVPVTVNAPGSIVNTATIGTAEGTWAGPDFSLACQSGEVLAGVSGRADAFVQSLSPLCAKVTSGGQWIGGLTARGTAGGTAGTAFTLACATNQAVWAFTGRSGFGLDQLSLSCKVLASGGTVTGSAITLPAAGGTGGSASSQIACPAPMPASGIRGKAGSNIGQFGLACSVPVIQQNQPPQISLTSPSDGAEFTAPASIVIAANVSDPDGNLQKVEFFNGQTKLGEATTTPFSFNWNSVLSGSYTVRAVATDLGGLTASASAVVSVTSTAGRPPAVLQSMKGAPVPEPASLGSYVTNRSAAIALGKALFWDVQVSSDGKVACASCHFQAGADVRFRNQSNPGMNRAGVSQFSFAPTRSGAAASGPNYTMKSTDFPAYVLSDPANANSTVTFSTTDVMGSQGVTRRTFTGATAGQPVDACADLADPVFGAFRQSTARNAPTVINAVFNFRNFFDGRANHVFNGVDSFGDRNGAAVIYRGNPPVAQRIALENSSLASQALTPPVNGTEMSCSGRTWPEIGKRLLAAAPLARQAVASTDSVLASRRAASGRGLTGNYRALVEAAFASNLWNSPTAVNISGKSYSQAEANFALFFGLALQMYQATLVSDDAPVDRYFANYPSTTVANSSALTAEQLQGLTLFRGKAACVTCHSGPQLTNAGTPSHLAWANGVITDRMFQGDGSNGVYDFGFYNIGVRATPSDLGLGGTDPFGNPLSFARQQASGVKRDTFTVDPCAFSEDPCLPVTPTSRTVVDGAFKTPTLRNISLTGPYFHDGSVATIEDVVQFYVRAGNARVTANSDSTGFGANSSNLAGGLPRLELSPAEQQALVAFLKTALTDDRVAFERAPFDHPELPLADGHDAAGTRMLLVPAVGSAGRATALQPFADLVTAGSLGYPVAPNLPPVVTSPGNQSNVAGTALTLDIAASDPEGDPVSFVATGLPGGLTINSASGRISGTPASAGTFSVTVRASDPQGTQGSAAFTWTITQPSGGAVSVSLTSPANGAVVTLPATVTLGATATQVSGTISKVEFYAGATLLATDTAAPYSFAWANPPAGSYALTAKAFGTGNATAVSAVVNITVQSPPAACTYPAAPVVDNFNRANGGIGASWGGASGGFSVTSNAAVAKPGDQYIVWNTALGAEQEASVKLTSIQRNANHLALLLKSATDLWTGGVLFLGYFPKTNSFQIWTYDTTAGWILRKQLTVTLADGDVLGGRVQSNGDVTAYRNGSVLTTASVANWNRLAAGGMAGFWSAQGDGTTIDDFAAGTLTCSGGGGNQPPSVNLTAPANGASFTAPATVALTATASDSDGTIAKVEFFQGATKLGEDTTAPYTFNWTGVAAGTYSLTARATDNGGATAVSPARSITVNGAAACTFPSAAVIDNFNRANGAIGSGWTGATGGFSISGNQLVARPGDQLIFRNETFGPSVEVSARVATVGAGTQNIILVLKSLTANWQDGIATLEYLPAAGRVDIWTYAGGTWLQHVSAALTVANGDVIGGRLRADGTVEVYKNGAKVANGSVAGWPHLGANGRPGFWIQQGGGTAIDDYRAGTLTCQ